MNSSMDSIDSRTDYGVVYKKNIGSYLVHVNGEVIACHTSTRLRRQLIYPTADPHSLRPVVQKVIVNDDVDPIAIGDEVRFVRAVDGSGLIVEVLPRRTRMARKTAVPMPGANPFEQVIVANLDQVVPVFAAVNPTPKWPLLDRYLVSAESAELSALICITKMDLLPESGSGAEELSQAVEDYRSIGYRVLLTSVVTGQGIDELKQALGGRTSVLLGKSGVGKTSLLNTLQPGLGLRVSEVSRATGKGRHTTSHLEMFSIRFDGSSQAGAIVDTPGVREFGMWNVDGADLALYFPEMRPLVGKCKFGLDCRHDSEPGCAIRQAVTSGRINSNRYQSYLRMQAES